MTYSYTVGNRVITKYVVKNTAGDYFAERSGLTRDLRQALTFTSGSAAMAYLDRRRLDGEVLPMAFISVEERS